MPRTFLKLSWLLRGIHFGIISERFGAHFVVFEKYVVDVIVGSAPVSLEAERETAITHTPCPGPQGGIQGMVKYVLLVSFGVPF